MIINHDLRILENDEKYTLAESVLTSFLERITPDVFILDSLYGEGKSGILKSVIEDTMQTFNLEQGEIREHNYEAPSEIADARSIIEGNKHYQKIHSSLLKFKLPDICDLEYFYGEYAPAVLKIIETYEKLNLKRKCELCAATHLNRVGAVTYQLKMNSKDSYNYSAIAFMHDSIEDLFEFSFDGKKIVSINYDLYGKFIQDYIPEKIQPSVKILTNHYNFFLNYINDKLIYEDKSLSKKNILKSIDGISKDNLKELSYFLENMHTLLSGAELAGNAFDSAKWECYNNLYLNGIAEASKKVNDYRLFQIKGIDLSDNAHGKGSLSVDAKIRNINKNTNWGIIGYSLESDWHPLNNHIQEIMEDALQAAEALIISDLLQTQSSQDFIVSALLKINKLGRIFYS